MDTGTFAVLIVFAIGLSVPIGALILGKVFGARRKSKMKDAPFESGLDNVVGSSRQRFSSKFYIIAMIFLVFDLEIVFLYPWAVDFREMTDSLGIAGLLSMFTFLGILLLGFVYLWKKGALDWED
jgi:NADH-quinone oxidoreductase subunit A